MADQICVALIYIGQAPRLDISDDIRSHLPPELGIMELGALDDLDAKSIAELAPLPGESRLITKLADGSTVDLNEERTAALLQERIDCAAQAGAALCVIMCTGSFPALSSDIPLITSDSAFHEGVAFSDDVCTIGLIVPTSAQIANFEKQYARYGLRIVSAAAWPYGSAQDLIDAAKKLAQSGADCLVLDCMGYSATQASMLEKETGLEVRIPRTELCRRIISKLNAN